jgi:phosphatidylserine/phosphatidylglycerophosphate/cardiolipin synthase-like enzyme
VNAGGTPIYVHAKICIVDDVWMTCGSDNFNRRSWTSDSELTCAIVDQTRDGRHPLDPGGQGDGARQLPRNLRMQLWGEHLGRAPDDPALLHAADGLELWFETASALDRWYANGAQGARPPGQARVHNPEPVSKLDRIWASPLYSAIFDPDGRPRRMRKAGKF